MIAVFLVIFFKYKNSFCVEQLMNYIQNSVTLIAIAAIISYGLVLKYFFRNLCFEILKTLYRVLQCFSNILL